MNNIKQIRTTQTIADRISEEARNSLDNRNGIRTQTNAFTLEKIFLGKFPIMVQSEFCVLHGMTRDNMYSMGECRNDKGGYFIIDGKGKAIISQEKFADNVLFLFLINHTYNICAFNWMEIIPYSIFDCIHYLYILITYK